MRVLMERDEMIRSSGRRAQSSRAGTVAWILALSCISLVHGATDPNDGTHASFLLTLGFSVCSDYETVTYPELG